MLVFTIDGYYQIWANDHKTHELKQTMSGKMDGNSHEIVFCFHVHKKWIFTQSNVPRFGVLEKMCAWLAWQVASPRDAWPPPPNLPTQASSERFPIP